MEKDNKNKAAKNEKPLKPAEKFIWLGASIIVALIGFFLRKSGADLHWLVKSVYSAFLLFTSIMAAQKTSVERFSFASDEEAGIKGDKKKYILSSIVYYLFVILSVFYVFYCLWVSAVLSV